MRPWNHHYDSSSQSGHRGVPGRPPFRPPIPPPRPPPLPRPPLHLPRPPLPPLPPPISAEEGHIIDKMAEAYNRNPELVAKVMDAQRDNPRYGFLHENSPLHAYYRWRISQLQGTGIMTGPSQRPPMPPPPRPPLSYLGSSPPMRSPDPSPVPPSAELEGTASCAPGRTRRYFELPAGLMVKAADGFHTPYSALRTADLEAPKFLDSIVACLSDSRDRIPAPELTSELSDALEHFERGVRCIYEEGEDNYITIDKEGWEPGVLEKVLWDRRKSSADRRRWKRAQAKTHCGNMVCSVSDVTESSEDSSESSSDSDSDSDGSSDSSSVVVRPTSVNKALGSDNVGFKMLEKLGWQQGQGLGAAGNGIVEPIRLATRFSSVRGARGRGRGRGRGVERASLGTGRRPAAQPLPDDGADGFESYRQQMSSVYKNSSQWHMQHHDKAADKP
ncbi:SURP and G-patch domain-containing protein 1 [Coemansia sp. RSA 2337]|nr:SURP and G-patch domain-containing protein 1 [Coemansia sp. RSA 2337]